MANNYEVGNFITSLDKGYRFWLGGVYGVNDRNRSEVVRRSKAGEALERLYGTKNYYLSTNPNAREKKVLEMLGVKHFTTVVRCRQFKIETTFYGNSSSDYSDTVSGTIDSSGNVTVYGLGSAIRGPGPAIADHYHYRIKSNNIENVETEVYHWYSDDENHINTFNFCCNQYDEYINAKKETRSAGKSKSFYRKAKTMITLEIFANIALILVPLISFIVNTDAIAVFALLAFLFNLPVRIIILAFIKKVKRWRGVNAEDIVPMSQIWGIIDAAIILGVSLLVKSWGHIDVVWLSVVLRLGFAIYLFALMMVGISMQKKQVLQEIRNADDDVEDYVNNGGIQEWEEKFEYLKRVMVIKSFRK